MCRDGCYYNEIQEFSLKTEVRGERQHRSRIVLAIKRIFNSIVEDLSYYLRGIYLHLDNCLDKLENEKLIINSGDHRKTRGLSYIIEIGTRVLFGTMDSTINTLGDVQIQIVTHTKSRR